MSSYRSQYVGRCSACPCIIGPACISQPIEATDPTPQTAPLGVIPSVPSGFPGTKLRTAGIIEGPLLSDRLSRVFGLGLALIDIFLVGRKFREKNTFSKAWVWATYWASSYERDQSISHRPYKVISLLIPARRCMLRWRCTIFFLGLRG